MTSPLFEVRARLSFPDASRGLADTGRAMADWASAAAAILAPELSWRSELTEDQSYEHEGHWGMSHIVSLVGEDARGVRRGRGESRLVAGGDGRHAGGTSRVELETVRPARYLVADNHCDVTHWDLVAAPLDDAQIERVRRALERTLGLDAQVGGERRAPIERAAQLLASHAGTDDSVLWIEDLGAVGLACRGHTSERGVALFLEHASLADVEALAAARITLGEVLSEAGHEDWHERWRELLVRLPEK